VFAGMLGVTLFGLLFTPAFYTVASRLGRKKPQAGRNETAPASDVAAGHDVPASSVSVPSRAI
jgi:hypothetical protein